jgi:hypothetical protein
MRSRGIVENTRLGEVYIGADTIDITSHFNISASVLIPATVC